MSLNEEGLQREDIRNVLLEGFGTDGGCGSVILVISGRRPAGNNIQNKRNNVIYNNEGGTNTCTHL